MYKVLIILIMLFSHGCLSAINGCTDIQTAKKHKTIIYHFAVSPKKICLKHNADLKNDNRYQQSIPRFLFSRTRTTAAIILSIELQIFNQSLTPFLHSAFTPLNKLIRNPCFQRCLLGSSINLRQIFITGNA